MNRTILQGDVIEKLKELPNECIDTVITSPPYWGLRDYGVPGQWGLEPSFHTYLEHMQQFMNEIRRVLKNTGSVWINLGDTYASSGGPSRHFGYGDPKYGGKNIIKHEEPQSFDQGLEAKSRIGMPERFYIQCIDNGWIARNHIPWYKPNAMPSSVKDRFTNKWESIFFFVKNKTYYFDLDSVRQKRTSGARYKPFAIHVREFNKGKTQLKFGETDRARIPSKNELPKYKRDGTKIRKWSDVKGQTIQTMAKNHSGIYDENGNNLNNPNGKNPGDVFFINPQPFTKAHFATFPFELPAKIISCACPPGGLVLDPFFGAGTVGLAAEKLGRQWIGIELNEEYIKIARARLNPYSNERLEVFE